MRDKYWDIIKALGIIAVVLGHIGILGYFVSLYHLVLFFFVAGYFYNEKYSTNLFNFFAKKLERLWWPTFKYTCFFTIFHNVFWTLYNGSLVKTEI
ncbi:acyltransferase family protein [Pectinatus brassicae]|uniref:Fucose 4-O-acetylase-like acetyltransferase n=1 Tax=Pectinatus brassicae TaxID=862415 RepID=A0A840UWW6_9FIRM|nr:acyltransferase family protein [Pectinatus brassicae]MBB5336885.1 fucose 4-O-acetylase-like acetyltransferase [Pectinatus brassicae]